MVPYKGDTLSTTQTSLTKTAPSSSSSSASTSASSSRPQLYHRKTAPDPSRLAPEDALTFSQIRLAARGVEEYHRPVTENGGVATAAGLGARVTAATTAPPDARRKREKAALDGNGGGGSRRRRVWKKLLWVKQSCK